MYDIARRSAIRNRGDYIEFPDDNLWNLNDIPIEELPLIPMSQFATPAFTNFMNGFASSFQDEFINPFNTIQNDVPVVPQNDNTNKPKLGDFYSGDIDVFMDWLYETFPSFKKCAAGVMKFIDYQNHDIDNDQNFYMKFCIYLWEILLEELIMVLETIIHITNIMQMN